MRKFLVAIIATLALGTGLTSCSSDADTVSKNLSTASDNFEVMRRIVFYNGITGDYMLEITGRCSLGNNDKKDRLSVTCLAGPDSYKKHYLGLSDNVTFFVEQINAKKVSKYNYKVVFKPESIIPDIDLKTSVTDKPENPYGNQ